MAIADLPQHMTALGRAQQIRLAGVEIKHEIKAGLPIAAAITDDRAGVLTVLELLMAQPRWGRDRAIRLLATMAATDAVNRISEIKRIRELTARQRALLAEWTSGPRR